MPSTFSHTPALSSADEVRKLRDRLDKEGKRLVLTNGCFDLLHAGHVRYLQQARALGDALVVALNSDESVRALKGPTRPLNGEEDRAEVLKALRCVDAVCVFREERATNLIEQVKPHVYAKGGDYTIASLNPEERAALDFVGAEIEILSLVPGRSTTNIIKRMTGEPEAVEETKPAAAGFKLGLLGSGEGSNFKAILNAIKSGELDAQIACVISDQPESGIVKAAREAELTVFVVKPGDKVKGFPESAQKEVCEHLQRAGVDLVVLCGFMRILREPVLSAFKNKIINVHPSLLPKYKGSHAVLQALDDGELETGTTVHLVTAEVDGGRVLAQARVPIEIGDTEETLHQRIKLEEHKLLPQVIARWIAEGGAPAA